MKKILISSLLIMALGTSCAIKNTNSTSNNSGLSSNNQSSVFLTNGSYVSDTSSNIDNTSSNTDLNSNISSDSNSNSNSSASSSLISKNIIYTLKGKIVDSNNNGINDITIKLFKNSQLLEETKTNSLGEFEFTNLEKGIYKLTFIVSDSIYEVQGTHSEFEISGDNETYTYPTIIVSKKDIYWGDLS